MRKKKQDKLIKELKKYHRTTKGNTAGSQLMKAFCKEAIKDLDCTLKSKDNREKIEYLTGIKVKRFLGFTF